MPINLTVDHSAYKNGVAQEDNEFILTQDQENALKRIDRWFNNKYSSPIWKKFFVLAGSAGTGKSSLVQYIIKYLRLNELDVHSCALTGKASLNLQRKGTNSSTIHKIFYNCRIETDGSYTFYRKDHVPYKLIIIDEASMISEAMFDDILSFGIPTIFIGDHCQLPPIEGKFNIMKKPDFTLTTILRQAAKSPIIRASQLVIKGQRIPYCNFQGFRKIKLADLEDSDLLWADQIIVGTNAVRHGLNDLIREIKGYKNMPPQKDERMIVLRNNPWLRICNGQIIYLESEPKYSSEYGCYYADWVDELEKHDAFIATVSDPKSFRFKLQNPNPLTTDNQFAYLDYGYAISCHKSQGSGWEKVLVYDDGFGFDQDTKRRWLYTAITRAKKEICIVSAK